MNSVGWILVIDAIVAGLFVGAALVCHRITKDTVADDTHLTGNVKAYNDAMIRRGRRWLVVAAGLLIMLLVLAVCTAFLLG